tara:strand:+ start:196 stop:474 length:279 start_codon:yes stop_codon:yes gene_type:complete
MKTKKAPHKQGLSQPELILSLDSYKPNICRKKLPSTRTRTAKPFMNWWEETLENHWPLDTPPDWDLLNSDQKRIYKLATLGYCLRNMDGNKQ